MGWAYGIRTPWLRPYDRNVELEIGYGVEDTCWEAGCSKPIDRGLGCACGGAAESLDMGGVGCGGFFCGDHLYSHGGFCAVCLEEDVEAASLQEGAGAG